MNESSTQLLATWDRAKTGVGWCRFGVEAGVRFGERTPRITGTERTDRPSPSNAFEVSGGPFGSPDGGVSACGWSIAAGSDYSPNAMNRKKFSRNHRSK